MLFDCPSTRLPFRLLSLVQLSPIGNSYNIFIIDQDEQRCKIKARSIMHAHVQWRVMVREFVEHIQIEAHAFKQHDKFQIVSRSDEQTVWEHKKGAKVNFSDAMTDVINYFKTPPPVIRDDF